eukprot:TRINITY_DN3502_c0_g2_i1.p1 TRINITY_DN3502_c0_g2~~TRINITY_DN3502_c0_g2_i1.p1  ORF type:complete len:210 (+),score=54.56 TRINITY_DN3502_c0_g2_i1:925-1554(+)
MMGLNSRKEEIVKLVDPSQVKLLDECCVVCHMHDSSALNPMHTCSKNGCSSLVHLLCSDPIVRHERVLCLGCAVSSVPEAFDMLHTAVDDVPIEHSSPDVPEELLATLVLDLDKPKGELESKSQPVILPENSVTPRFGQRSTNHTAQRNLIAGGPADPQDPGLSKQAVRDSLAVLRSQRDLGELTSVEYRTKKVLLQRRYKQELSLIHI